MKSLRSPLSWLGGLLALYLLVPLVAFLIRLSVSTDRGFTAPGLWDALGTSVLSATISTVLIAVFGIPLAYVLAKSKGRFAAAIGVLVQLPLALPPVMSGIVLIYLVGPYTFLGQLFGGGLTGTVAGIVIAQTFVASPFLVVSARSAFRAVDPALDDLATSLGHGPLSRFWRVAVPSAAEGIKAGLLMAWLRALGEYGATVLLAYHPYSLPVFTYVQFSGIGVPNTQAPTALALLIAALGVAAGYLRLPRMRRARPLDVAPHAPRIGAPVAAGFRLDLGVGSFRLALAHRAGSARLAILGRSGSGKSVTLRAIAGLIHSGTTDVDFASMPAGPATTSGSGAQDAAKPRIGYVPQGGILFPRLTVWEQVTFGVDADPGLASWWLHTLHLDGLENRMPDQLSGGQRQRVALAQALSRAPALVLLDEPFSALDAPVREELRMQLRQLQHENALSTILVTHDPEEAALLADEILVIDGGEVLQAGTRAEVYRRPATPHVARLLGIHNLSTARIAGPTALRTAGGALIEVEPTGILQGTDVAWCIRPEDIVIAPDGPLRATVLDSADLGTFTTTTIRLVGGPELRVRSTGAPEYRAGEACRVELRPSHITVWPVATDVGGEDASPEPNGELSALEE